VTDENAMTGAGVAATPSKRRPPASKTVESSDYARGRQFGALELRVDRTEADLKAIGIKLDEQARDFNIKLDAQTATLTTTLEQRLQPLATYIQSQQDEEERKKTAAEARDKAIQEIRDAQKVQINQQKDVLDVRQKWVVPVLSALLGLIVSVVGWSLTQLGKTSLHGPALLLIVAVLLAVPLLLIIGVLIYAFRQPRRTS